MTRGHRGSLTLRCRAFPSPPPCRFIPALQTHPRRGAHGHLQRRVVPGPTAVPLLPPRRRRGPHPARRDLHRPPTCRPSAPSCTCASTPYQHPAAPEPSPACAPTSPLPARPTPAPTSPSSTPSNTDEPCTHYQGVSGGLDLPRSDHGPAHGPTDADGIRIKVFVQVKQSGVVVRLIDTLGRMSIGHHHPQLPCHGELALPVTDSRHHVRPPGLWVQRWPVHKELRCVEEQQARALGIQGARGHRIVLSRGPGARPQRVAQPLGASPMSASSSYAWTHISSSSRNTSTSSSRRSASPVLARSALTGSTFTDLRTSWPAFRIQS